MDEISKLREKNKINFNTHLQIFVNSNKFKTYWCDKLGFSNLKIVQLEKQHFVETLEILSYQFSCLGGTHHAKIFMRSVNETYKKLGWYLNHAITVALGYVVLDQHNHVIAVCFGFDHLDKPNQKLKPKLSIRAQKIEEIFACLFDSNKMYQKYIENNSSTKYGDIFNYSIAAVKPDSQDRKIGATIIPIMDHIVGGMKYKYCYLDCVHPKTVYFRDKICKNYGLEYKYDAFDYSKFKFKDGTTIQKYYNDLKNVYKFSDKYVEDLKLNQSIIKFYLIEFEKVYSNLPKGINLWQLALINNLYVSKL